jgi:hypothetical protein
MVANSPRSVSAIKGVLADKRPAGISIPVYNSWYRSSETQRTGRLNMRIGNEPSAGGHALCLVGYQDDANYPGGGYFILRNSWSTSWGYQCPYGAGYGTIPYQYVANDNWESYSPASRPTVQQELTEHDVEESAAPGKTRTITIRAKGNLNIVIE